MCKGRLAVLCLVAASLLAVSAVAYAGVIDPCESYWILVDENGVPVLVPCPLFVCPQNDTPSFLVQGWYLIICLREADGITPVPGVPASDFWVVDCDPAKNATLCGGSASSNADSMTNANGETTMSQTSLAAGGCANGMAVIAAGDAIEDPLAACAVACANIKLRSPDINGDLTIGLQDLSLFSQGYPPQAYKECSDMNIDNVVNLQDLSSFAFHYGPPGHHC